MSTPQEEIKSLRAWLEIDVNARLSDIDRKLSQVLIFQNTCVAAFLSRVTSDAIARDSGKHLPPTEDEAKPDDTPTLTSPCDDHVGDVQAIWANEPEKGHVTIQSAFIPAGDQLKEFGDALRTWGAEVDPSSPEFSRQFSPGSSHLSSNAVSKGAKTKGNSRFWSGESSSLSQRSKRSPSRQESSLSQRSRPPPSRQESSISSACPSLWVSHTSAPESTSSLSAHAILTRSTTRCSSSLEYQAWLFFEDSESTSAASFYAKIWPKYILFTVLVPVVQTVELSFLSGWLVLILETCIDSVFLLEVIARFLASPSKRRFASDPYALLDMMVTLPILVSRVAVWLFLGDHLMKPLTFQYAWLVGAVPVLRFLKILRHFKEARLLYEAYVLAFEALPVLLYMYAVLLMVSTVLVFVVEPDDNIATLPEAFWLVFVSATTIGYGDVTPQSAGGAAVISALVLASMLYTAIPVGIIGTAFSEVWHSRQNILLKRFIRQRILMWGYVAKDMSKLFDYFDQDGDEVLNKQEFCRMLAEMEIGFSSPQQRHSLFKVFDTGGDGSIDRLEFISAIFPEAHTEIQEIQRSDAMTF